MSKFKPILLASACTLLFGGGAFAADASNLTEALTQGKFQASARLRYEYVDQAGLTNNANAMTGRLVFNYQTKAYKGFTFLTEFEGVGDVLSGDYNSTINGKTTYPVVADPHDASLNRFVVEYSGIPKNVISIGRQTINLNNQRYVGAVGWRQNDQTFDAVTFKNTAIANLEFYYAYANRVNRIFGTYSAQGTWRKTNIHMLNVSYKTKEMGKFTFYSYLLDIPQAVALSTQSTGVRYEMQKPITKAVKFGLNLEYAKQSEYASNHVSTDLVYYSIEPSLSFGQWNLKAQIESKGSNGVRAYQFPLGTNHAFDGWVDKFLTTPTNGLVDTNFGATYTVKADKNPFNGLKLMAIYHDFQAEHGGLDYGTEWDFSAEKSIGKHWVIGAKYGDYNADKLFTDTTKFMPYVIWKF